VTRPLVGPELAERLRAAVPGAVVDANDSDVWVRSEDIRKVCSFLREDADTAFDFLVAITSVDYVDYFEVVYRLTSLRHNHSAILKTRAYERDEPVVPSVVAVWKGADLQEREVFDLMGVRFEGHPGLKRILTWEGFEGHPLRKDFLLQRP